MLRRPRRSSAVDHWDLDELQKDGGIGVRLRFPDNSAVEATLVTFDLDRGWGEQRALAERSWKAVGTHGRQPALFAMDDLAVQVELSVN
jgi:hypothetical protein